MSNYLTILYSAFKHKSLANFRAQDANCYQVIQSLKNNAEQIQTNEALADLLQDYKTNYPHDITMNLVNIIAFYNNNIDYYNSFLDIQEINYPSISMLVQAYNLTIIANILEIPSYLEKMVQQIKKTIEVDTSYLDAKIETLRDLLDFVEFMPLGFKVVHGII